MSKWEDLTPEQQASTGNGCGPKWFPRWATRVLFGWFHEPHCRRHDFDYQVGGSERDRINMDKRFMKAMFRSAVDLRGWRQFVARAVAVVYWIVVRALGWIYFQYGGKPSISSRLIRNFSLIFGARL